MTLNPVLKLAYADMRVCRCIRVSVQFFQFVRTKLDRTSGEMYPGLIWFPYV